MINKNFILASLCLVGLFASPLAWANPHQNGHGNASFKGPKHGYIQNHGLYTKNYQNNGSFSLAQQQRLSSLLAGQHPSVWTTSYRQQLLSQQTLPPGILKNLQRGKPLPPGLANKINYMPLSTYKYLGIPYNNNSRLGSVGRNVILYNMATGIVREVLGRAY